MQNRNLAAAPKVTHLYAVHGSNTRSPFSLECACEEDRWHASLYESRVLSWIYRTCSSNPTTTHVRVQGSRGFCMITSAQQQFRNGSRALVSCSNNTNGEASSSLKMNRNCFQVRTPFAGGTRIILFFVVQAGRITCQRRVIHGFRSNAFSATSSVLLLARSVSVTSGREAVSGFVQSTKQWVSAS